jgi:hypothetical protein
MNNKMGWEAIVRLEKMMFETRRANGKKFGLEIYTKF